MARPALAAGPSKIRKRIIVALDVPSAEEARRVVDEVKGLAGAFKVGMQLFTACGPQFVRELTGSGVKVFLDLKFHDIPNTVARAGVEAARLGVWMFNVHAAGGVEMMRRTATAVTENCDATGAQRPLIVGVTVLTSSDQDTLNETGVTASVDERVAHLAGLAAAAGLDGVVASPREVVTVRRAVGKTGFLIVTPGIRDRDATSDDQRRITTIGEAIAGGSDFVVVGRQILDAKDRVGAMEKLVEEAAQFA